MIYYALIRTFIIQHKFLDILATRQRDQQFSVVEF